MLMCAPVSCTAHWMYELNGCACTVHLSVHGSEQCSPAAHFPDFCGVWLALVLTDYRRFTWHCNKQVLHLGTFFNLN